MAPMQIGIPYMGSKRWTAGHVYSANLIAALKSLPPEDRPELTVFLGPRRSRNEARNHRDSCEVATYGCRDAGRWYSALAGGLISLSKGGSPFGLARVARNRKIDVLFPMTLSISPRFPTPWMGWVADYQCMHFPEFWARSDAAFRRNIEALSRTAPFLVVSSEAAKRDAQNFFDRSTDIATLPFALLPTKEWYARDPISVARRFGLPERFVVFPSQFWKHKDHETLIRAMLILKARGRRDLTLVLCGLPKDTRDAAYGKRVLRLIGDSGLASKSACSAISRGLTSLRSCGERLELSSPRALKAGVRWSKRRAASESRLSSPTCRCIASRIRRAQGSFPPAMRQRWLALWPNFGKQADQGRIKRSRKAPARMRQNAVRPLGAASSP